MLESKDEQEAKEVFVSN